MAKKLYIGNLSYETTEDRLREAFAAAGTVVSAMIITDKFNGNRSKGFGFVEMGTDEEAQAAIQMLHDSDLDGRKIRVNEARPLEERPPRKSFDRGSRNDFNKQW